jgi:hypothetical protein
MMRHRARHLQPPPQPCLAPLAAAAPAPPPPPPKPRPAAYRDAAGRPGAAAPRRTPAEGAADADVLTGMQATDTRQRQSTWEDGTAREARPARHASSAFTNSFTPPPPPPSLSLSPSTRLPAPASPPTQPRLSPPCSAPRSHLAPRTGRPGRPPRRPWRIAAGRSPPGGRREGRKGIAGGRGGGVHGSVRLGAGHGRGQAGRPWVWDYRGGIDRGLRSPLPREGEGTGCPRFPESDRSVCLSDECGAVRCGGRSRPAAGEMMPLSHLILDSLLRPALCASHGGGAVRSRLSAWLLAHWRNQQPIHLAIILCTIGTRPWRELAMAGRPLRFCSMRPKRRCHS